MPSITPSFPPQVTLATALNASNPSVLAANAFADPNSGYASGLRLSAALADNKAGHFNLASGITLASNALDAAFSTLKDFQSSLSDLYSTVSRLRNPAENDKARAEDQQLLSDQISDLQDRLKKASVANYNFLDATRSDGVQLDLNSGALSNAGKTPLASTGGSDQRFAYSPDRITLQTPDLSKAVGGLSQLITQTFPYAAGDDSGVNPLDTIANFKSTLNQASDTLKTFQDNLNSTAIDRLNAASPDDAETVADGAAAQQIAARLAQQLHNDSFNVSSSAAAHYFSLFA